MGRVVGLPQPDGPTSTMNSPASTVRLRSSTAVSAPKSLRTRSNFTWDSRSAPYRAAEAERAAEVARHEQVKEDRRKREQEREDREVAELEESVRAHEVVDLDRAGLVVGVAVQHEGDDESAPRVDERVDRGDRDAGERQRKDELPQDAESARTIDGRGFLELAWDGPAQFLH